MPATTTSKSDRPPVAVASGPSQPVRGLRASCRLLPLDCPREKKKKNWTCMFRRISTIFILSSAPLPFPFCMPSRPQTFSEQSQQAVNTDQHRSPPAPGNPATKVFSRMFWGGDGPQATLPSSGQFYVQPRHSPSSHRPPRASVCLQGAPQPRRSCFLSRPWPPGHTLLGQAHCQPQSEHQHPPGLWTTSSYVRGLWLQTPGRPLFPRPRGQLGASSH